MHGLKRWRVLDTGYGSAAWNMAVDEALLNNLQEDDLPILRLYVWEPALSLGKFSDVSKSIDMKKIESVDLPVVRRMTGGGVLVHGGDLSYTLLLPRNCLKGKGVKENYRYLCGFLINLYEKLGLKADFACDLEIKELKSDICLAGTEAYDIMIEDKKMGGNAQRYTRQVLFQHGSIPIKVDKPRFKDLFLGASGLEGSTTLEEQGYSLEYEQLVLLVSEAFRENFDTDLIIDTLHPSEEEDARKLLADKYTQQRWNLYAQ